MGWSYGFDEKWQRDVGYGVPARCDQPGCGAEIDRGLSYVCGSRPYGGEHGCGLFFCEDHRVYPEVAVDNTGYRVANEIMRVTHGSRLYGTHTDQSDNDMMAVFVEPPDIVFSERRIKTVQLREFGPGERAQPGQTDGLAYSVRHFADLALHGNPSVLAVLFAPQPLWQHATPVGRSLWSHAQAFVSKLAAPKYDGFMGGTIKQMVASATDPNPAHPDLVAAHGYDTKAAAVAARVAYHGFDLATTGKISSPMHQSSVARVRAFRDGAFPFDQAVSLLNDMRGVLNQAWADSKLPDEPDWGYVHGRVRACHESWWNSPRTVGER